MRGIKASSAFPGRDRSRIAPTSSAASDSGEPGAEPEGAPGGAGGAAAAMAQIDAFEERCLAGVEVAGARGSLAISFRLLRLAFFLATGPLAPRTSHLACTSHLARHPRGISPRASRWRAWRWPLLASRRLISLELP